MMNPRIRAFALSLTFLIVHSCGGSDIRDPGMDERGETMEKRVEAMEDLALSAKEAFINHEMTMLATTDPAEARQVEKLHLGAMSCHAQNLRGALAQMLDCDMTWGARPDFLALQGWSMRWSARATGTSWA